MKKVILLIIIVFLYSIGYDQIIIDQSDAPEAGDTLRMSVTNILSFDYTKTGLDTTWDFSSLAKLTQRVDTFLNVMNVPPVYWITFPPVLVSNLASSGNLPISIPGIPVSNFFSFYNNSAASFSYLGFAFQISGFPIIMKYDNPDIWFAYPCTMGNTWNSQSYSAASIPGLGYYSTSRDRTSKVDGWGDLITPFGKYQTIRIKSQWVEHDSIYLDTLGTGFPLTRNITEYIWLGKNQGMPLLQITEDGITRTAVYRDYISHTGIRDIQKGIITVSPNPSDRSFVIHLNKTDQDARLEIFSPEGSLVSEESIQFFSGESNLIHCEYLSPGIYFLRIRNANSIFTGKIIKR